MAKKGGATLVEDAPWRVSSVRPIPKINRSPVLSISQNPETDYAISVMKHPNPVGGGFAMDAVLESAGPECIVPGQVTPLKLLGVKVWPVEVDLKFLEPVGKELKMLGKHPNPVGGGFAMDAVLESAGPECIVPGQVTPLKVLGVKLWPVEVDLQFLEPVGKELKMLGKFMDNAVELMNKSFIDR